MKYITAKIVQMGACVAIGVGIIAIASVLNNLFPNPQLWFYLAGIVSVTFWHVIDVEPITHDTL